MGKSARRAVNPFVLCPFYRAEQECKILCTAAGDVDGIHVYFRRQAARTAWQERYCKKYDYTHCWIAAAVERQWEDEEDQGG